MKSKKTVAVIGLGYVGLPLALLADQKGYKVFGIDINKTRITNLNENKSDIDGISKEQLLESQATFTTDVSKVSASDVVLVCVPTPVGENKIPDLTPLEGAIRGIAPHLKDDTLILIESTINPGVCDEVVIPLLEKKSDKKVGETLYVAHCPERVNPGDPKWNVSNISRVVGANTQNELDLAKEFYDSIIDAEIKPMGTIKEAEAVKMVENSFRDINIAFVNELAMSFHRLDINLENVIDGASTKPFAFMPHHPGCGVGGHCIPVDPYYLIDYADGYGFNHEFLRLARSINEGMPAFTVDLLKEGLNEKARPVKGTRVALLGLSYKDNVGDKRESPAYVIKSLLQERDADLKIFDPYVDDELSTNNLEEALEFADAIVIATGHKEFRENLNAKMLKNKSIKVIVDGRNILRHQKPEIIEAGVVYKGIGV